MTKIRIIVADDHALVRAGLASLVNALPGMEVVGEAGNGREALQVIGETFPDLVLLDVAMPEMNGFETTQVIVRNFPEIKVIIVSMHRSPEFVMQALRSGADGYILKDSTPMELEAAIHAVARGESFLSPGVSRSVISSSLDASSSHAKLGDDLTSRQREVLALIVQGRAMKEIAGFLNVSVKTIEAHRAQIMVRLKIHDVPGLVRYAMRVGLVAPEPPTMS